MNMDVVQKIKRLDSAYLFNFVKVHYNNALSERYSQRIYSIYNDKDRQVGHCVNLKLSNVKFEINEDLKKEEYMKKIKYWLLNPDKGVYGGFKVCLSKDYIFG